MSSASTTNANSALPGIGMRAPPHMPGGPPMPGPCIPPCSEGVVDISRLLSAAVSGDLDHKEVQRGSESSCPSLAIPRSHGGNQVSPMYPLLLQAHPISCSAADRDFFRGNIPI